MTTKQDFMQALDEAFKADLDMIDDEGKEPGAFVHHFLAESVFDFTLYDSAKDIQWSNEMLSVVRAILEGTTFDMIRDPAGEEVYLKMVNMPFMEGMLDWGGSIRGAWFDTYGDKRFFELACGITIERCDLKVFMEALLEWSALHLPVK